MFKNNIGNVIMIENKYTLIELPINKYFKENIFPIKIYLNYKISILIKFSPKKIRYRFRIQISITAKELCKKMLMNPQKKLCHL